MKLLVMMAHASQWSVDIADSLRACGYEIHLLDFDSPADGHMTMDARDVNAALAGYASVTLISRPKSGWTQILMLARSLRELARRLRPDVLLCLYGGRYACAAYLSGVRPYAVYVVGSDVLLASAPLRLINRYSLGAASGVFANGVNIAERTRLQAPSAMVESLLIGVDFEQIAPAERSGPARIFNHRAFAPVYNNETIIHALALLPSGLPPFQATFASSGPDLQAAQQLADRLFSQRKPAPVCFLEGRLRRHELLAELVRSDIFVSMSRSDGTPTSALEAMAGGVFPVLSDIPANRALVDVARGIGTLVATEDAAALASELSRRILDVEQCRAHAASIRAHVLPFAACSKTRATLARRLADIVTSFNSPRNAA